MTLKRCTLWGEETRETCKEYRDEGYNDCSNWGSKCCDWWPCSWACKIVTWFCKAWYWVANIVCVAWTYITEAVCLLWEVIVLIVSGIVAILEAILGILLNVISFIVELIFSIPIIGAFLRELWTVLTDIGWRIVGIIDVIGWIVGIRPEKKLRIIVMILRDEVGKLVADKAVVLSQIQRLIDIYYDTSNVTVISVKNFGQSIVKPLQKGGGVSDEWIIELTTEESAGILDVDCGASAVGQDYWTQGAKFNWLISTKGFWTNGRRLLGYGAPITIFVVRSISNAAGCSLNVLSDYICVGPIPKIDNATMAHECSHSCGLWEVGSPKNNLMYNQGDVQFRDSLSNSQIIVLRDSKHITYF